VGFLRGVKVGFADFGFGRTKMSKKSKKVNLLHNHIS
jgi:hypothetical protein